MKSDLAAGAVAPMEPVPTTAAVTARRESDRDRLYLVVAVGVLLSCLGLGVFVGQSDLVTMVAGAAVAWIGQLVQHRFGSSRGSERKTELMAASSGSAPVRFPPGPTNPESL